MFFLCRLNKKALTVYEEAMTANNENDEEVVFIYLMKYCEMVQLMKTMFKTDKVYISLMEKDKLRIALKMLTHIKESLENR